MRKLSIIMDWGNDIWMDFKAGRLELFYRRVYPGLILYARDTTGQYSFEAVSVTDSPEPFYDYVYEHEDRTTYRRFKRYERSCFRWPKSFNEEKTVYIVTGKGIEEADYRNWRMPYYPMEWP